MHDYLVQYGGAERVLEAFVRAFPSAPIYTLLYDAAATRGAFAGSDVRTSSLQNVPLMRRHYRFFPPLLARAIEEFDFSRFDVVLSSSSSFAKGIITRPETLHVSYIHTPMRYAWDDCQKYTQDFGGMPRMLKRFVPLAMTSLRVWDRVSAQRVDHMIANSSFVAQRIRKYYRRDATVIHPPVDFSRFALCDALRDPLLAQKRYFLMVGRLVTYKRYDLAIRAANALRVPLYIIGQGPEAAALRSLAGPTVRFLSHVDDATLARYYVNARAFLFPQEEDFGIVAVEAMAAGRPIIAYRAGGILEHLEDGVTGIGFDQQSVASLTAAMARFEAMRFDHAAIAQRAQAFDKEMFARKIRRYVEEVFHARDHAS